MLVQAFENVCLELEMIPFVWAISGWAVLRSSRRGVLIIHRDTAYLKCKVVPGMAIVACDDNWCIVACNCIQFEGWAKK